MLLAGCGGDRVPIPFAPLNGTAVPDRWFSGTVYRVDYPDAGVSCWVLIGAEGRGGISCLEVPHG